MTIENVLILPNLSRVLCLFEGNFHVKGDKKRRRCQNNVIILPWELL